ncbi:protein zer-1 homolog [Mizuhopecten yessoensis]|uniref:Protein zer-1 homolog n=1 Tax=Mizuhopecten yessoensis TaxID=6573 RepID=A0A210QKU1_MIZYE|nr:protein zer-1 homolog [Mizuhopecten yessoensis]XP_021355811.1 protein zer-1 homolog [Mizuhopecten yessoensis]OWF49357.1 Protein zer-1-like [Mizuhopecten yessoensis]
MTNAWPDNKPDTLENICLGVCAQNQETFCVEDPDGKLSIRPGVDILPGVVDRLVSALKKDDVLDLKWINLFRDTSLTRLTRIDLSRCSVSDTEMNIVTDHPLHELILTNTVLSKNTVECINKLSRTLRILKYENNPHESATEQSFTGVIADMLETGQINNFGEKQFGIDFFVNTPNLRILSLRDCYFREFHQSCSLEVLLTPLTKLTHLDLSRCVLDVQHLKCLENLRNLMWLNLSHLMFMPDELEQVIEHVCKCKQLRHLDISCDVMEHQNVMHYVNGDKCLRKLMSCLPYLTSLDLSGTDIPKILQEDVSHKLEPTSTRVPNNEKKCCITGLDGRIFEFLGLLHCRDDPCNEENLPAKQVSGHATEEQVLISIQRYYDRDNALTSSLNSLFKIFRYSTVKNHCAALEAILLGMRENQNDKQIQISGSASLFYIVKGPHKDNITYLQKRRLISCLLDAMERQHDEMTMLRNGCLTICNLSIPQDVLFCYKRLVKVLIDLLKISDQEEFIQRISIYLLNCLACQVDGDEKRTVGTLGAVEVMLDLIRNKWLNHVCDEVLEVAWSTLWNVTDETADNCEKFMNSGGMDLFKDCLQRFVEKPELLRNMMGLMGNIAEVKFLRPKLMDPEYITMFSDLLDSKSDGIEVSYNAAGIFSHLMSDGPGAWTINYPSRDDVIHRLTTAIERWPINSGRNINYRSFMPIFKLVKAFDTSAAQHWSVWALANLTLVYPGKYCSLLKKEGGVDLLEEVIEDPRPNNAIRALAKQVLVQVQSGAEAVETYNNPDQEEEADDDSQEDSDVEMDG